MYTVIGNPHSRTLRVLWMLEELGEPFEHVAVGPRAPEVLEHNPSGKVPVVLVDGDVLTDSAAIITYLADRHGKLTAPAGTLDRARQDAMSHRILDELDSVLWAAARHSFILPEDKRVPDVKASLKWEFAQSTDRIAEAFGDGPFAMGTEMTIADILLAHCLGWAVVAKFPVEAPVLRDHLARMRERPAYQRALAR